MRGRVEQRLRTSGRVEPRDCPQSSSSVSNAAITIGAIAMTTNQRTSLLRRMQLNE